MYSLQNTSTFINEFDLRHRNGGCHGLGPTLFITLCPVLRKALQGGHCGYLHVANEDAKTQPRGDLLSVTQRVPGRAATQAGASPYAEALFSSLSPLLLKLGSVDPRRYAVIFGGSWDVRETFNFAFSFC